MVTTNKFAISRDLKTLEYDLSLTGRVFKGPMTLMNPEQNQTPVDIQINNLVLTHSTQSNTEYDQYGAALVADGVIGHIYTIDEVTDTQAILINVWQQADRYIVYLNALGDVLQADYLLTGGLASQVNEYLPLPIGTKTIKFAQYWDEVIQGQTDEYIFSKPFSFWAQNALGAASGTINLQDNALFPTVIIGTVVEHDKALVYADVINTLLDSSYQHDAMEYLIGMINDIFSGGDGFDMVFTDARNNMIMINTLVETIDLAVELNMTDEALILIDRLKQKLATL